MEIWENDADRGVTAISISPEAINTNRVGGIVFPEVPHNVVSLCDPLDPSQHDP